MIEVRERRRAVCARVEFCQERTEWLEISETMMAAVLLERGWSSDKRAYGRLLCKYCTEEVQKSDG